MFQKPQQRPAGLAVLYGVDDGPGGCWLGRGFYGGHLFLRGTECGFLRGTGCGLSQRNRRQRRHFYGFNWPGRWPHRLGRPLQRFDHAWFCGAWICNGLRQQWFSSRLRWPRRRRGWRWWQADGQGLGSGVGWGGLWFGWCRDGPGVRRRAAPVLHHGHRGKQQTHKEQRRNRKRPSVGGFRRGPVFTG